MTTHWNLTHVKISHDSSPGVLAPAGMPGGLENGPVISAHGLSLHIVLRYISRAKSQAWMSPLRVSNDAARASRSKGTGVRFGTAVFQNVSGADLTGETKFAFDYSPAASSRSSKRPSSGPMRRSCWRCRVESFSRVSSPRRVNWMSTCRRSSFERIRVTSFSHTNRSTRPTAL